MGYELRTSKTQLQSGTEDSGVKSSFFRVSKMGRQILWAVLFFTRDIYHENQQAKWTAEAAKYSMPSRRKQKRSCVKIRLLFWNASCCLSISYFYTDVLALAAWVKVSGSSHAKRITSGCMENKEIPILFLSHWYLLFLIVKAAATVPWNTSFIQEIFKVTVKHRGAWACSPYSGKISSSNQWALPCSEGMAECVRRTPYDVAVALSESSEQSIWKAAGFCREALPRVRDLTFGLTVIHLIYRHSVL